MDDSILSSLRAAGAMIGETNLASWEELIAATDAGRVRFGIADARREFDTRHVTATQVAKAMRLKLKCHEPERKKGEPLIPRAEAVGSLEKLVDPSDVETLVEMMDAASPAKPPLTPTAAAPKPPHGTTGKKGIDYVDVVARMGGGYLSEIARAAGVSVGTPGLILKRLVRNKRLEVYVEPGKKRERYRVPAAAAKPGEECRPAAPIPKSGAYALVTPTVDEPAAAPAEVVQPEVDDPPGVEAPPARVAIMPDELDGPLRPLLERLLEAFAARRGFAYTLEQLGACQDLVGVRR